MQSCNEARIRQFLTHELSIEEEREFEQHLSSCEVCCRSLEDSTADEPWWEGASHFLNDQPDDLSRLTHNADESGVAAVGGLPPADNPSQEAVRGILKWLGPTDDPRMIGRVGKYEIAGVIGAGGMSVVLKALDPALNRYVAIKVLSPHLATSGAARQRFAREAQASAAIVHENVIDIHGVSEANDLPFIVMPYVVGESLQKRLDQVGPLRLKEILRIATQTAYGLAAAHAQGLIHRDVKPANILLADGIERVTITDFGLARAADDASLTRTGTISGTPQYMSPEQARGEDIDQRSDLFSLGSVIYAMCTGRAPFRAESSYAVLGRIADSQPRAIREINSDIPEWLRRFVDRLHAKSADDRYATATQVASDLEQCLAHVNDPTREPLPASVRPQRTKRAWWIVAVVATCAPIVLAGWALRGDSAQQTQASQQPQQPSQQFLPTDEEPAAEPTLPSISHEKTRSLLEWDDGIDAALFQLEQAADDVESEFNDWLID